MAMETHEDFDRLNIVQSRATVMIGLIGIIISLLLTPPIFSSYFAISLLMVRSQLTGLWLFSGFIFLCSVLFIMTRLSVKFEIVALYFGVLLLISLELGAKLLVVAFMPEARLSLARLATATYPEFLAVKGHPFLHDTGNPSEALRDHHLSGYNNLGFIGQDFTYEKPENVIRIATPGGSTTASGYPLLLEDYLNENKDNEFYQFEVMNFGIWFYTSAHSLVNFVLNVVDFSSDYVIIHHGWNDRVVRNTPSEFFRNDYSHALQYFHEPTIIDKYPIRVSILYRFLKNELTDGAWISLENAVVISDRATTETIIDLAELRGMKVVLTTQPHSTDPASRLYEHAPHIDQTNNIIRELSREHQNTVLFVDLDGMMTGKMNGLFRDIGHLYPKGRAFKAEQIGKAILSDLHDNDWTRVESTSN